MEVEWDVEETVEFLISRCFTSVALQFPDELLQHSTKVATLLNARLGSHCKVYVLAVSTDDAAKTIKHVFILYGTGLEAYVLPTWPHTSIGHLW